MNFRCNHVLRALCAAGMMLLLAAAPAPIPPAAKIPSPPPVQALTSLPALAPVQVHPVLWTVHSPKGTAYLLGSIHVLKPQVQWRTPQIDAALKAADIFAFEIPMDASQNAHIQDFIRENGYLPPGTALPSLLNGEARKDYAAALQVTHVPPETLTPMRPWLALLVLEVQGGLAQRHFSVENGVDRQVYALALKKPGASFRAFETPEQQLRLLMPEDKSLEIQEFDAGLKDLLNETMSVDDLIDAWGRGDVAKMNDLMNSGFKENPRAEKTLFEDRNRAWAAQLETMLSQRHVFFVTVGAGHLVGPKGLPALLRLDGYRVDGP